MDDVLQQAITFSSYGVLKFKLIGLMLTLENLADPGDTEGILVVLDALLSEALNGSPEETKVVLRILSKYLEDVALRHRIVRTHLRSAFRDFLLVNPSIVYCIL